MLPDYYGILGVDPQADLPTIRAAYRRRAKECHPDRGGLHATMVLINEAGDILSDPERRSRYDTQWKQKAVASPDTVLDPMYEAAQSRAAHYPARWSEFEQWLDGMLADARAAQWSVQSYGVFQIPVARQSTTGTLFVAIGSILGALFYGGLTLRSSPPPRQSTASPVMSRPLGAPQASSPRFRTMPSGGQTNPNGGPSPIIIGSAWTHPVDNQTPKPRPFQLFQMIIFGMMGAWAGKGAHWLLTTVSAALKF